VYVRRSSGFGSGAEMFAWRDDLQRAAQAAGYVLLWPEVSCDTSAKGSPLTAAEIWRYPSTRQSCLLEGGGSGERICRPWLHDNTGLAERFKPQHGAAVICQGAQTIDLSCGSWRSFHKVLGTELGGSDVLCVIERCIV